GAGVGIDVGRRATHDPLDDLEPHPQADRDLLPDQIELAPGWPAGDVEVAAKSQRMDRHADDAFDCGNRSEVDDRDHLVGDVGKAETRRVEYARRATQFVGAVAGEEALDRRAPFGPA